MTPKHMEQLWRCVMPLALALWIPACGVAGWMVKRHLQKKKEENPQFVNVTVGQYADYLDTGLWTVKDGQLIPPPDLTPEQLRDFQMVFGELVDVEKE